jgi:transposase InsO family protein
MAWKAMDVQEQRVRFVVAACRREKPVGALCAEFGISRPTGLLWIKRYREAGLAGICERSRRPRNCPAQTAGEQEERVIALRHEYPDWGARKLGVLLDREGVKLTRSTIHRILLRYDLVSDRDRHTPAVKRFERERPNELWQMDFKGPKNWPHRIGPLSVIDDHSRYLIALSATGKLDGDLVREQLQRAFERCGVPDAMLMDHGTPWWNWQSFSGRTHLSLWMMRQGIRLCWSGIRHPQTQGKVERFHGSLQRALDRRGGVGSEPQRWLDAYRSEYNEIRPHEALGMQTPSSIWRKSERRYQPAPPPWVYPEGAWVLKVDCQGTVDLHGRRWRIGKTLAGERVLIQPVDERMLVYFCSTLVREIDPSMPRSTIVERGFETHSQKNKNM